MVEVAGGNVLIRCAYRLALIRSGLSLFDTIGSNILGVGIWVFPVLVELVASYIHAELPNLGAY